MLKVSIKLHSSPEASSVPKVSWRPMRPISSFSKAGVVVVGEGVEARGNRTVQVSENQASRSRNAASALGCQLYRIVAIPIAGVTCLDWSRSESPAVLAMLRGWASRFSSAVG